MKKIILLLALCAIILASCMPNKASDGSQLQCDALLPDKEYNLGSGHRVSEYTITDAKGCKRKMWRMYSDAIAEEHMPDCDNPDCPYKNNHDNPVNPDEDF